MEESVRLVRNEHTEAPAGYVNVQQMVNTYHRNGAMEHPDEDVYMHIRNFHAMLRRYSVRPATAIFLGCRTGYEIREFITLRPLMKCHGVDIVPLYVEKASEYCECTVADMHSLPFEDGMFDIAFSAQALEHCYTPQRALGEILRVTKQFVYLSLPLENKNVYDKNPSHFAWTSNPLGWLFLLEHFPTWQIKYAEMLRRNTIDILLYNLGALFDDR